MNKGFISLAFLITAFSHMVSAETELWNDINAGLEDNSQTVVKKERKSYIKQADDMQPEVKKEPIFTSRRNQSAYVGASASQSRYNDQYKDSAYGYKVHVGYREDDYLAVELSYADFGTLEDTEALGTASADGYTYAASIVAMMPLSNSLDVFGRAGFHRWHMSLQQNNDSESEHGIDPYLGAGIQLGIDNVSLRAEYEKYFISTQYGGDVDLDLISVGGQVHF